MTPRKRAVIYLRISSDPTGLAAGVDRQLSECVVLASMLGVEVDLRPRSEGGGIYCDNDISATTGVVRPDFEQLLLDREECVITWHADRLVRVGKDLERVIDALSIVHAVTSSQLDLATPAGRAVARTIIAWATYEGEQKALRQKAAHDQRARAGRPWWTIRPFAFERDGTHVEPEAMALRLTYAELLASRGGTPLTALAAKLNADGWRTTYAGRETKRGGAVSVVSGLWNPSTVRQLLLAPRNAGILEHGKVEVGPASWTPIVPEETLRAAAKILNAPERRRGGPATGCKPRSLLTGIAVCGTCGGTISVGTNGYVCRPRSCVTHPKVETDSYVIRRILGELAAPGRIAWWIAVETGRGGVADVETVRAELVRYREIQEELVEDRTAGLITRAQLVAGTADLAAKIKAATEKLEILGRGSALDGASAATSLPRWFGDLTLERQRAVTRLLLGDGQLALLPRGRGVRGFNPEKVKLPWEPDVARPVVA